MIAITIPYHVRSCVEALERWGGTLIGHPDIATRLPDGTPVHGDEDLPLGLTMHKLSRGKERPLELPAARRRWRSATGSSASTAACATG